MEKIKKSDSEANCIADEAQSVRSEKRIAKMPLADMINIITKVISCATVIITNFVFIIRYSFLKFKPRLPIRFLLIPELIKFLISLEHKFTS
jgi:hypothetical protein